MIEILLIIVILLLIIAIGLIFLKQSKPQDLQILEKGQERVERAVKDEISKNREESGAGAKNLRDELFNQLTKLTSINTDRLDKMRETIEERLKLLQDDNSKKLEKMRETVDEKLQSTLEKRLGESFKFVSERLEMVHKGLGEMQNLAIGVGDLKKVLTNIKSRGTWGEMQLEKLLEEVLSPEQYEKNVATKKGSSERVEFAVKLPGKEKDHIWLPIDSKFPKEDYEKLVDAQDRGDIALIEELGRALEIRIKSEAKDIREKYINPPNTTDFGIMFLPFEGLYAEVLRRPGLAEILQRDYRVIISGPTTIYALLNSLQMGFRTLAIEKRASEVWKILSAVIVEFGKFGDILDKTKKKLEEATNTIDDAARKSRTIESKLKRVQTMPAADEAPMIGEPEN
ncbi:MAG: DNA recombination protein RmuC [Candidatus Saganbacteria bacterium]|nr:DNA recombination protein RmuC [Candidatus Saganbacteria bacterium]